MTLLPAFSLSDSVGVTTQFPSGRHALLCILWSECPTCHLTAPLIDAAHRSFGEAMDIWAIGQDAPGNGAPERPSNLTVPMLDDSSLGVSRRYGIDTVPAIILADGDGHELSRFVGFSKDDWQQLFERLISVTLQPAPAVNWAEYPAWRPGCGSKLVAPVIPD